AVLLKSTKDNDKNDGAQAADDDDGDDDADYDDDVDVDDLMLDTPHQQQTSANTSGSSKSHGARSSVSSIMLLTAQLNAARNAESNISVPELPHSTYLDSVDFVNACKLCYPGYHLPCMLKKQNNVRLFSLFNSDFYSFFS